ncbi:MAG: aminoacyl-tRNA hydrolase [Anaerolineae bacterium]|nr:aminoacyl-tRNA hydrolase [Thermoflexales bacterium]MDW8406967.1 aminoacyl-tRNA hydrolase [Anaerolineae bacterium]
MSDQHSADLPSHRRRVIVGLGNPGRRYADTRHNVGFAVVERLAEQHNLRFNQMMNRALIALGEIEGEKVVLVKPQTFMNDSGSAVAPIARFYKVALPDLLVIYDELDLPFAQLRMRPFGGNGGHNGMKSIIAKLGSQDFPRLRVGIGRPPGKMDPAAFVLQPFTSAERAEMSETIERAVAGLVIWLKHGIDRAMNVVNIGAARLNSAKGTEASSAPSVE